MAATIRIKRTATSNRPASLKNAELAFIEGSSTLIIGTGVSGENAASIIDIGGTGAFLGLANSLTQTAAGTYTFSGGVTFSSTVALGASATATTPATSDSSTAVATTAYVKAQNYLTANQTVTLSGDATGSGTTAITVTVANDAITNAKLANMATGTLKGRAAAGTGDPEDLSASAVKTLLAIVHTDLSDFDTGVQQNRLDQMAAPTSAVSMNSQKLTNVATPTDANDAANKAYVDAARSGLDVKASVRVATTANITLSGEQAIDGVSVVAGDRVLVKNQDTGSQNGIYVCAAGSWSRATDADENAEVTSGLFTFVEEGTANADSGWVLTTNGAITVGTTSLAFAQFSGTGQITAGDGLTKSGSTLNVVGTADRITANADSIDIASTYAGQSSIVTVGTLTSGALGTGFTAVAVAQGGLGLTSAVTGLLKGAAGAYSAAVAGTDYLDPNSTIDGGTYS